MRTLTPFLWFDTQAEQAVAHYLDIFKDGTRGAVRHHAPRGPGQPGQVMSVSFTILGQSFTAFNGGPHFRFNESISMFVDCDTQAEVDELWERLSAGGQKKSLRLAQGQIRPVVANRAQSTGGAAAGSGSPTRRSGDGRYVEDGQT